VSVHAKTILVSNYKKTSHSLLAIFRYLSIFPFKSNLFKRRLLEFLVSSFRSLLGASFALRATEITKPTPSSVCFTGDKEHLGISGTDFS